MLGFGKLVAFLLGVRFLRHFTPMAELGPRSFKGDPVEPHMLHNFDIFDQNPQVKFRVFVSFEEVSKTVAAQDYKAGRKTRYKKL